MRHMCNKKGFTMIEVIVATVILTFISGAAYTMLHSGTLFTSRQTTQAELRNDSRQILNEIVKKIQESNPSHADFPGFPDYQEQGYLTGTTTELSESVVSSEIAIRGRTDKVIYRYDSDEQVIMKRTEVGATVSTEQVFLRNATKFEIMFNKNKLDYTISAIVKQGDDFVNIDLQAVPRIQYIYVDGLWIEGNAIITRPAMGGEVVERNYTVYAYDQLGRQLDTTWLTASVSGLTDGVEIINNNTIRVSHTTGTENSTIVLSARVTEDLYDEIGDVMVANFTVTIVNSSTDDEDPSNPPPNTEFLSYEHNWDYQGHQWQVDYSNSKKVVRHRNSNSNHVSIYKIAYGNYTFDTKVTVPANSSRGSQYGLIFGGSNSTLKSHNDNYYFYVEIDSNNKIDIKFEVPISKKSVATYTLLNDYKTYNNSNLDVNLKLEVINNEVFLFVDNIPLNISNISAISPNYNNDYDPITQKGGDYLGFRQNVKQVVNYEVLN